MKTLLTLLASSALAMSASAAIYSVATIADFDSGVPNAGFVDDVSGDIRIQDLSNAGKPQAQIDFGGNVLGGVKIDLGLTFNNTGLTGVSDPEIRLRMGNSGTSPTSDSKTGFGIHLRNPTGATAGDSQIRAGEWNGSKISSQSTLTDLSDTFAASIVVYAWNGAGDATYAGGTLAENTYDLWVGGTLIEDDLAMAGDTAEFTRATGFGNLIFLGSSNSDEGVSVLFDNIAVSTLGDSGISAVPEPSAFGAIIGLFALGMIARRRR